jgi:hypothetical protein
VNPQLFIEKENRPGIAAARGVVVPGNQDHRRIGKRLAKALELPEGKDD